MDSELVAGGGGIFDVWLGDLRVFSKHEEGGFPEDDEVLRRVKAKS